MEFKKEFLQEVAWDDAEDVEVIYDKIVDTSRWSEHHDVVFKYDGKYYSTYYSQGLTENQHEDPYEFESDLIDCPEVFPTEVVVIEYKTKEQLDKMKETS